jgi:hypothetical protein
MEPQNNTKIIFSHFISQVVSKDNSTKLWSFGGIELFPGSNGICWEWLCYLTLIIKNNGWAIRNMLV